MWIKKLKKKKFQFGVIGIILLFSTAILTACLSLSVEMSDFTKEQYNIEKNSDYYLFVDEGFSMVLEKEFQELNGEKGYFSLEEKFLFNNKSTDAGAEITFALILDDYRNLDWGITKVNEKDNEKAPRPGEIWVQKIMADNVGAQLNDSFTLNNKVKDEFKISAIVKDSLKPNSIVGNQIVYINKSDVEKFKNFKNINLISIKTSMVEKEFNNVIKDNLNTDLKVYKQYSLKGLINSATLIYTLVSNIGLVAALFMLVVTIIIIRFFIRSIILQEYSTIGTYKSLGFKSKEIRGFYQKCYLVVGSISAILGALIGIPISYFMGIISVEYLGTYTISYKTIVVAIITAVFSFLLLYINVRFAFRKINKISPVDALRIGVTSTKSKLKKSLIKNGYSPLSMGINDIFKYKGRSLLIILVVSIAFYISIVFLNMCYSFETLDDKASAWVSIPTAHCMVQKENDVISDDVLNYIKNNKYTDKYVVGSIGLMGNTIESVDESINLNFAWKISSNTYEKGIYAINYSNGRVPENAEEIGVASSILKGSNYKVGDYIKLKINGKDDTFLITGTFDTIGSDGSIHFLNSYFKDEKNYKHTSSVLLKNKDDYAEFKNDIESKFPEYKVITISEAMGNIKESIQAIMIPITIIIIVIFFVFTLLNIINLIIMTNKDQEKNFGIMKAYGFTSGYIIRRNLYKISILSSLGLAISILLNALITRKIFWMLLGCDGYNISVAYTSSLVLGGFLIIVLTTVILSNKIRRISPKELMEE